MVEVWTFLMPFKLFLCHFASGLSRPHINFHTTLIINSYGIYEHLLTTGPQHTLHKKSSFEVYKGGFI